MKRPGTDRFCSRIYSSAFIAVFLASSFLFGCGRAQPGTTVATASTHGSQPGLTTTEERVCTNPSLILANSQASTASLPGQSQAERITRAASFSHRKLPQESPQIIHVRGHDQVPTWDREKYLDDPAGYLDFADLSRSHQPAQPAADVAMIGASSGTAFQVHTLRTVELIAQTEPGMPVSYASYGLGAFESGLPCITVAADESGFARANFTATEGTVGDCMIQAASPVRGGIIQYFVTVIP